MEQMELILNRFILLMICLFFNQIKIKFILLIQIIIELFYLIQLLNHQLSLEQVLFNLFSFFQISFLFFSGLMGSGTDQLNSPMSLTIQAKVNLFIADYGNNRIVLFNLTTGLSTLYLNQINSDRSTYVLTPISIKADSNSLVIAQATGFNVIRWVKDSPKWSLIAGSASSDLNGTSRTLFNQLCSSTIDAFGNTYVNDCYNQRIQFYAGDMTKGRTIAGVIQARGNNIYTFNFPTAIALDTNLNLYVADSNNFRIQKFNSL